MSVHLTLSNLLPAALGWLLITALPSVSPLIAPAQAAMSQLMDYQGRLTDTTNNPRNGTFSMTFKIYDALSGGTQLWTETQGSVSVDNGFFSVQLGAATPIPVSVFAQDAWLDVTVAGETLLPRQPLVMAPYAATLMGQTTDYFVSTAAVNQTILGIKNFSGNLGIGTSAPDAKLHAFQAAGAVGPQMIVSTGSTKIFEVSGSSVVLGSGAEMSIRGGNVGIGTNSAGNRLYVVVNSVADPSVGSLLGLGLVNLDTTINSLAGILFSGSDTGGNSRHIGAIVAGKSDTWNSADGTTWDSFLSFWTRLNGGSEAERLRIAADGNIGVGTISPSSSFDVFNGSITVRGTNAGLYVAGNSVLSSASNTTLTIQTTNTTSDVPSLFVGQSNGVGGTFAYNTTSDYVYMKGSSASGPAVSVPYNAQTVGLGGVVSPLRALHLIRIGSDETLSGIMFSDDSSGNYRTTIIPNFAGGSAASNKLQMLVSDGTTTGQVTTMVLTGAGNVGIGTSAPVYNLEVKGNIAGYLAAFANAGDNVNRGGVQIQAGKNDGTGTNTLMNFLDGDGTQVGYITYSGVVTTYTSPSDRRIKEDIRDTRFSLADLMKVQVKDFKFIRDRSHRLSTGFIAQDLYEIYPDAVSKPNDEKDPWGVDYGKITPLLVKSVQELYNSTELRIKELRERNQQLESRNAVLEKTLERMDRRLSELEKRR